MFSDYFLFYYISATTDSIIKMQSSLHIVKLLKLSCCNPKPPQGGAILAASTSCSNDYLFLLFLVLKQQPAVDCAVSGSEECRD